MWFVVRAARGLSSLHPDPKDITFLPSSLQMMSKAYLQMPKFYLALPGIKPSTFRINGKCAKLLYQAPPTYSYLRHWIFHRSHNREQLFERSSPSVAQTVQHLLCNSHDMRWQAYTRAELSQMIGRLWLWHLVNGWPWLQVCNTYSSQTGSLPCNEKVLSNEYRYRFKSCKSFSLFHSAEQEKCQQLLIFISRINLKQNFV